MGPGSDRRVCAHGGGDGCPAPGVARVASDGPEASL